jgi:hypothetical protein
MSTDSKCYRKNEVKISAIETTSDRLTGRAGLSLFVAYLHRIEIFALLERLFGSMRKNKKGTEVFELFKQLLCFMVDGTSRHLTYFDQLAKDEGYAGSIETDIEKMASSHQMKRFFNAFAWTRIFLFRRLLHKLFIWRLHIKQPDVIELGIDTMVMDNDDAECRHGVKPTYKKKKGFQPLQMNWGRLIVDAVFRGGDKHSNHGTTVEKMIQHMVAKIRKAYRPDVAIIIRMDSGFFDQKIFGLCERLGVGYLYLKADSIVACYHERGSDELANRALKDFGHEQLPFKRFNPNAAWYYSMLLGHFLMETFKEDVGVSVVPVGAYATTVRRRLIDIAGKIVSHSGKMILKVTAACFEGLGLSELFNRCNRAPIII